MFSDAGLTHYAHNCFIPIDYPIFTAARPKANPLHHPVNEFAKARLELSLGHAVQVHKLLEESTQPSRRLRAVMPYDIRADETAVVSNISIARVVDINWTGLGGKRTMRRYKTFLSEFPLLVSDIVTTLGGWATGTRFWMLFLTGNVGEFWRCS
jgi:hypothetical protein